MTDSHKMGPAKGGVHKLQIFCPENTLFVSNNLRSQRSLNARLGHSKAMGYGGWNKSCKKNNKYEKYYEII